MLATADLRILVVDSTENSTKASRLAETIPPDFIVVNKIDLKEDRSRLEGDVHCSAETGQGVDELQRTIVQRLVPEQPPSGAAIPFLQNHREAFERLLTPNDA